LHQADPLDHDMFVGGGLPLTKPTLKIVQRPKGVRHA
jgi:hypothetical protein